MAVIEVGCFACCALLAKCLRAFKQEATAPGAQQRHAVATPGPTAGRQRGVQATNPQQGGRLPPISTQASTRGMLVVHSQQRGMLPPAIQSQAAAQRLAPIEAKRQPVHREAVQSIRYTQDSIKDQFQGGNALESAIRDLRCERTRVDEFPTIRVFQRDGLVFSCDNRRLYVFKQFAKLRGDAPMMVPVKWVKPLPQ
eukprot:5702036-Amphidinium_carterae.2